MSFHHARPAMQVMIVNLRKSALVRSQVDIILWYVAKSGLDWRSRSPTTETPPVRAGASAGAGKGVCTHDGLVRLVEASALRGWGLGCRVV